MPEIKLPLAPEPHRRLLAKADRGGISPRAWILRTILPRLYEEDPQDADGQLVEQPAA